VNTAIYIFAVIGAWFVITALVAVVFGIVRSVRSNRKANTEMQEFRSLMEAMGSKWDGLDSPK
jgi:hypothetical protein